MDFNNWNDDIRLKKSWFILGNRVVFLGSDITNPNRKEVYTSIENRKLKDSDQYKVYVNNEVFEDNKTTENKVSKVFLESKNGTNENIGYYFLNNKSIVVEKEHREGSWSEVNKDGTKDAKQNSFIKISQNHKDNSGYAYIMMPSTSKDEFEKASMDDIKVLANTDRVQAVYDQTNSIWGISLFEDEVFKINDDLSLDKKGLYTIKKDGSKYVISYFDPSKSHTGNDLVVVKDGQTIKKPNHAKDYYLYEFIPKKLDSQDSKTRKPNLDNAVDEVDKTEDKKTQVETTEEDKTDEKSENRKVEDNKIGDKSEYGKAEDNKTHNKIEAEKSEYSKTDNKSEKEKAGEKSGSIEKYVKILNQKSTRNTRTNTNPKTGVSSSLGYIYLLGVSVLALFKKIEK